MASEGGTECLGPKVNVPATPGSQKCFGIGFLAANIKGVPKKRYIRNLKVRRERRE
jgi:hypothetical protein